MPSLMKWCDQHTPKDGMAGHSPWANILNRKRVIDLNVADTIAKAMDNAS